MKLTALLKSTLCGYNVSVTSQRPFTDITVSGLSHVVSLIRPGALEV